MLFTLSLMSFKHDSKVTTKQNTSTKDSTGKNLEGVINLLSDVSALPGETIPGKDIFALNPNAVSFVQDFTKREGKEYNDMKSWAKPYFDLYDKILSENGLPVELKYLSVIESNLQSNNVTGGAAVGPWQLMPYEGKRFGLKMRSSYDERTSYTKSTEVAAKLLKELYAQFGDWLLVVGAYNCGIGGMKRAIAKAGTSDFWKLQYYLPEQTRNHVKKFIAAHYIFEGCGGWTTVTAAEAIACRAKLAAYNAAKDSFIANNTGTTEISGKYNSSIIMSSVAIGADLFNLLNPAMDKSLMDGKSYTLRLPLNKMPLFISNREQILEQSVQLLLSSSLSKTSFSLSN